MPSPFRWILNPATFLAVLAMGVATYLAAQSATPPTTPAATPVAEAAPAAPFPVTIQVDAAKALGPWKPVWRFFGADEPNYATMKNGEKLIKELGELSPPQVYFRTHNLMTTGDGTPGLKWGSTNMYHEDADGKPVYDWTIVDHIFDTYLKHNVRPYVQLGFMPKDMSTHPDPYQHHWDPSQPYSAIYTGWSYPPKDYAKWGELVYQWAKHCVERYGMAEVEKWYWETWNESNAGSPADPAVAPTGPAYWRGSANDYQKLNDYAFAGVRKAIPKAIVGGADAAGAGGQWTRNFIEHCLTGTNYATGQVGTPLNFISFHAKGSPGFVQGNPGFVRLGISNQLRAINDGFTIVASYPQTKNLPIVIGESDPDGCAACQGPQLGYRNTTLYPAYTAACITRELELADRHGVNLEGALTWAFEFDDFPFFAGQRTLATNGIDLPVMNIFRMLRYLDGQRISAVSSAAVPLDNIMRAGVRGDADVSTMATLMPGKLCVLVCHYHDDDVPGPDANITVSLTGLPANLSSARLTQYRIDHDHSNSFTAWQKMGSPAAPTPEQFTQLEAAGQLQKFAGPPTLAVARGAGTIPVTLPRDTIALFVLEWDAPKP